MQTTVNQEIFEKFPEARFHAVVFEDVNLVNENIAADWKQKAVRAVEAEGIKPELLVEHFAIKEWRDAYHKFGLKPSKYRSSIEQLYKRALKSDYLQTRFPLVNLYCYTSIVNLIPMGGYDVELLKGNVEIRLTEEGEKFQAIGERESIVSPANIVSYADGGGIICWAWNHRDSVRTCLNENTRKAIFFSDSATNRTNEMASKAIRDLSHTLSNAGCKKLDAFVLSVDSPQSGRQQSASYQTAEGEE